MTCQRDLNHKYISSDYTKLMNEVLSTRESINSQRELDEMQQWSQTWRIIQSQSWSHRDQLGKRICVDTVSTYNPGVTSDGPDGRNSTSWSASRASSHMDRDMTKVSPTCVRSELDYKSPSLDSSPEDTYKDAGEWPRKQLKKSVKIRGISYELRTQGYPRLMGERIPLLNLQGEYGDVDELFGLKTRTT